MAHQTTRTQPGHLLMPVLAFLTSTDGTVGGNIGLDRIHCIRLGYELGDRWALPKTSFCRMGYTATQSNVSYAAWATPAFWPPKPEGRESSQLPRQRWHGLSPMRRPASGPMKGLPQASSPRLLPSSLDSLQMPLSRSTACASATHVSYTDWASPDAIAGLLTCTVAAL